MKTLFFLSFHQYFDGCKHSPKTPLSSPSTGAAVNPNCSQWSCSRSGEMLGHGNKSAMRSMSPLTGHTQPSVVAFSDPFLLCIQECGLPFWSYLIAEYLFFLAKGLVCSQCFTAVKPAQSLCRQQMCGLSLSTLLLNCSWHWLMVFVSVRSFLIM